MAHTLVQGKRLLCNDMWGLGLISLSLVVGYTSMEAVKASLRKLACPPHRLLPFMPSHSCSFPLPCLP